MLQSTAGHTLPLRKLRSVQADMGMAGISDPMQGLQAPLFLHVQPCRLDGEAADTEHAPAE